MISDEIINKINNNFLITKTLTYRGNIKKKYDFSDYTGLYTMECFDMLINNCKTYKNDCLKISFDEWCETCYGKLEELSALEVLGKIHKNYNYMIGMDILEIPEDFYNNIKYTETILNLSKKDKKYLKNEILTCENETRKIYENIKERVEKPWIYYKISEDEFNDLIK